MFALMAAQHKPRILSRTIRKTIAAELRHALRQLDGEGPFEHRVHETRRDLKKARAALRLVRGGIGAKRFRRANGALRGVARRLSGIRDAQILVAAFDKLAPKGRADVRRLLVAEARRAQALARGDADGLNRAIRTLRRARRRAKRLKFDAEGWAAVSRGLRRTYRDGRRAMKTAFASRGEPDLHEWRKQAKHLRYELQLLEGVRRPPVAALCAELHALSDIIGEDRDLGLLDGKLRDEGLRSLIAARRRGLRAQAEPLGRRLYAERPKAFMASLKAGLKSGVVKGDAPIDQRRRGVEQAPGEDRRPDAESQRADHRQD